MRAGAYTLSLLSDPIDIQVLRILGDGQCSLFDLRRALGSPPQTTLRKHLRALVDLRLLKRYRGDDFPGTVSYELSEAGCDLLPTVRILSAWLAAAPDGSLPVGGAAAKSAIKALVDGWSSMILRVLAARPLSLTEVDRVIASVNYPALERRMNAMRLAGHVTPTGTRRPGTPYRVTHWLREAVGPLASAARWELRQGPAEAKGISRQDFETMFLLAIPLVRLPPDLAGSCLLQVDLSDAVRPEVARVAIAVDRGRAVPCLDDHAVEIVSSARGTASAWLDAFGGRDFSGIAFAGDKQVASQLVAAVSGLREGQKPRAIAG